MGFASVSPPPTMHLWTLRGSGRCYQMAGAQPRGTHLHVLVVGHTSCVTDKINAPVAPNFCIQYTSW